MERVANGSSLVGSRMEQKALTAVPRAPERGGRRCIMLHADAVAGSSRAEFGRDVVFHR